MRLNRQNLKWVMLFCCSAVCFLLLGVDQLAQTAPQTPTPTGHVNDFAGVVNEKTRQQLENILANVKRKTGIEFAIATVESTAGQDISEFSLQLARDWNIGSRNSTRKSLLLVLAVTEKTSFTRFSRSVQPDLPEGVLGEMGQRMRALIDAGDFSAGLNAGVGHFVNSLAQKLAFSTDDLDKAPPSAATTSLPTIDNTASQSEPVVTPPLTEPIPTKAKAPARNDKAQAKTTKPNPVDDEAESEEVELTLTLPAEGRVAKLTAFLESHPESKSRARATELLVSSRAALGDEKLKQGDAAGGIEQLRLAIVDAPVNAPERLFSGVISQIPLNLYMRGEQAAATKAAQEIETKFGSDAKRLVGLSGFYVNTEQGAEAVRVATLAVQLAPDLAEAHYGLGRALHVSLRLEDAVVEYKRALELDPKSKPARRSLADLSRAFGKSEEALALYRQQLEAEPSDKTARNGMILSLLDLGRTEEGNGELEKALQTEPRNLALLAGAAYWLAAHGEIERAQTLARRAIQIEPRYTWSHVAVARTLLAQQKPLEAERALRFARQYGKFPTLDYELASVLVAASLYEEAAEILTETFSLKEGKIETRLAGQSVVSATNFVELLAPERRASIFQSVAADSEGNARLLKALLAFAISIGRETNGGTINEENALAAAREFTSGDDAARVHRQLFAASRLLQRGVGSQLAFDLAEAARSSADAGLSVPALTLAVQADEFRGIRSRAIAAGGTPDIPDAPRNVLSNLLRGRIEDIAGWANFNQDKLDEAADHLKRAVAILPEGTPAARTSLWRLGATLERQNKRAEALPYYIKSYNSGEPDRVRRSVIEQLYRKVNGSLEGLDQRIGPAGEVASAAVPATDSGAIPAATTPSPEITPAPTSTPVASTEGHSALAPSATPVATPQPIPSPEPPAAEVPADATPQSTPTPETPSTTEPSTSPEPTPQPTSEPTPDATPEPAATATPEPAPTPTPTPESTSAPTTQPALDISPVAKMDKALPATVKITGRAKDASGNPIADVVVVLISPQGTVLASTTDEQGNFSFTVAPSSSTRSYRIIPTKAGLTFDPVDRVLPTVSDDVKELDFVGTFVKQSVRLR